MNFLCIDTSTEAMSISINRGDEHFIFDALGATKSSDLIIAQCLEGLKSLGLEWNTLSALVYDRGPGSFTALRTACAVLQGFSLVHELPCLGFSSLLVLAQQALIQEPTMNRFLCLLDARMGEVYWGAYEWQQDRFIRVLDPQVGSAQDMAIPAAWQSSAGEGFGLVGHTHLTTASHLRARAQCLPLNPHASALHVLAPLYFQNAHLQPLAHLGLATPLYVRNQVAQTTAERLKAKMLD